KRILDIGCGAGRFAEVVADTGAKLLAIDYSSAVDACYANLKSYPQADVAQANVYELPLKPGSFDYVYCFGVLQHTPDPHASVLALAAPLKRGGKLALDFYPRLLGNIFWPKYWLRPLTRRMNQERLFRVVQLLVRLLLPLSRAFAAVPLIGRRLRYLLPIMAYYGTLPLSEMQHREWAILDTFDMLAPAHDHPQTAASVQAWLAEAGLRDIEAERAGLVIGRATKA
ncbi:MAG TPA: class I SAM-dependent methyltransferase, partial [Thermoanaerobaculia bacterium]|nr:class I SAM-dependent methyltransferase [Thermoanaerobaculia bacterium]